PYGETLYESLYLWDYFIWYFFSFGLFISIFITQKAYPSFKGYAFYIELIYSSNMATKLIFPVTTVHIRNCYTSAVLRTNKVAAACIDSYITIFLIRVKEHYVISFRIVSTHFLAFTRMSLCMIWQ